MLRPKDLEDIPEPLIELYSQAEMDILADMARRISTYDYFIPAAQWQYQKLIEMGNYHKWIIQILSSLTNRTRSELETMMKDAGQKTLRFDDSIYKKAGLSPPPIAASPTLQKVLNAGLVNTMGIFQNLTKTTAGAANKQFINALDRAYMMITTGGFDHNTAIRRTIKDLAANGLTAVNYPTGHRDTLEVAVRRATLTGVNQTAIHLQDERAKEMGCDLVETSAHSGARPEHAKWQGKIFSRSGKHPKYPDFQRSTGYGTGEGLGGWNCRHSFSPYIEGVGSQIYTPGELAAMEDQKYIYNGRKMNTYEASQRQRYIERQIRQWKREKACMDAAKQDSNEAASKVTQWQSIQRDFIKQTGLRRQYEREQVFT